MSDCKHVLYSGGRGCTCTEADARYAALEAEAGRLHDAILDRDQRIIRLESALEDFRDHGVRHDLHPTMVSSGGARVPFGYLKSIDDHVRAAARAALKNAEGEG